MIVSSIRKASKHGEAPMPHSAAYSSRFSGTALTRVIPLVSTQVMATASTSAARRSAVAERPRWARSVRARPSSMLAW
jgi:hypothetical protein